MTVAKIYRAPRTRSPLRVSEDRSALLADGASFPVADDTPDFLGEQGQGDLNDKYMHFYDKVSLFYKLGAAASAPFSKGRSDQLLGDLAVPPGGHVLETSVGTGNNLRYLSRRYPNAVYYGMDISGGMLRECRKNLRKWRLDAHLARANAQSLPYADGCFDVVFHIGGINYFDDKQAAVNEMIRVAKPGSRIVIIDETDKWVREVYRRMPVVSNYYGEMDGPERTNAPVRFLPDTAAEIRLELIWKGGMYKLSFRTPE